MGQENSRGVEEITLRIDDVVVGERIRKDFGDIDELVKSIREVGLIQPIVLSRGNNLIAGERRLRALRKLGITELVHAKQFVYNDELDELKLEAMQFEENIKRKQLDWREEILAKKRLLEIMQKIHGLARSGYSSRSDAMGLSDPGFGVNKLAALLGESPGQTSKDLELADYIEAAPQLAKAETKEAARRQAAIATTLAVSLLTQQQKPKAEAQPDWVLFEGDFVTMAHNVANDCVDLVIVDPPYGEDAQGKGPQSPQLLAGSFQDSYNETIDLIKHLAKESYRVLKPNKFAVFFFGFKIYGAFCFALRAAGLEVDTTPLIWAKSNVINTAPYSRYGRSYEPILVARKGEPKLFRPSQRDVVQLSTVTMSGSVEQKFYHAQKPVEIIEKFLLDMTAPGEMALDFCAGSGTLGVAAVKNNRKAVMFEKDPVACNIIRARMAK